MLFKLWLWVIRPFVVLVFSRALLEICHALGFYPEQLIADAVLDAATKNWETAIAWMLVAIVAALILWFIEWRRSNRSSISISSVSDQNEPTPSVGIRSPEGKQKLVAQLKGYASEYSVAHLLAFPAQVMPLLETLDSIFKQAGWQTNFTNTPQEPFIKRHLGGTQVSGFSKHLVDDVAQFLREAGLHDIKKEIKENKISPDNPKYPYTLHRINITLGYQRDE